MSVVWLSFKRYPTWIISSVLTLDSVLQTGVPVEETRKKIWLVDSKVLKLLHSFLIFLTAGNKTSFMTLRILSVGSNY